MYILFDHKNIILIKQPGQLMLLKFIKYEQLVSETGAAGVTGNLQKAFVT